jgi:outer membrane protein assembly factor BamB
MMGAAKPMGRNVRRIGIGGAIVALACGIVAAAAVPPAAFRFPLTEASRLTYDGDIRGVPATSGTSIYFGTDKGFVYAVAAGDAPAVAWRFAAKAALLGSPALGGPGLLVSDASNRIYLLDPGSGRLRWAIALTGRISAGACWGPDESILVAVDDADLVAFDARGFDRWRFTPGTALRGGPAFIAGSILIGTAEGKISVLAADGRLIRTCEAGGPIAAPPFADRDRIYANRDDGNLICLDPVSGKIRWTFRLGGTLAATPAADADRLYVPVSNGVFFCLSGPRGDLLWWHSLPAKSPFPPWVGGGLAVAASRSPILAAFKADNGDKAGTLDAGTELRAGPARSGDRLLINLYDPDHAQGTMVFLKGEPPKAPAPAPKQIRRKEMSS